APLSVVLHCLTCVDHRVGSQVVCFHDGRAARVVLFRQIGDGLACGHLMVDAAAIVRGSMPAAGGGTGAGAGAAGAGPLAGDLHGLTHVDHRVGSQVVGLHDG